MATASKWLQWMPAQSPEYPPTVSTTDTTDTTTKSEHQTTHSVGSVSFAGASMERHDHQAWQPEFERWATTECLFRDHSWQSISSLHVAFCEWAIRTRSIPCRRDTFERLLESEGFFVADGMVLALMLSSDLLAMGGDR
jgi:hypothetical protein